MKTYEELVREYRKRQHDTVVDTIATGLTYMDQIAVDTGILEETGILTELTSVLGLLQQDVEEKVEIDPQIQALIDERQAARKAKNYARADEIRDQLAAQGITLKDTPQGVQVIKN